MSRFGALRHLVRRPFSAMSAVACGSFLAYLGALPSLYLPGLEVAGSRVPAIAATGALGFVLGIPFGRFLLRVLPVRGDDRPRRGALVFGFLASITWLGIWLAVSTVDGSRISIQGGEKLWLLSPVPAVRMAGYLAAVAWWFGAFVPFLARHWAPQRLLSRPFVLFLRRFSSFADRSAVSALLGCMPAGKPLAFLTPTASAVQDWNPFQIGFAGLKLWRPLRSIPIDLRAGDRGWQSVARSLIARADVVVLDASRGSGAIESEIEMIRAGGFEDKTVVIAERSRRGQGGDAAAALFGGKADVVSYRKTWFRALPRLLAGAFATALAVLPLASLLILALVPGAGRLASPEGDVRALSGQIGQARVVLPLAALALWIYFVLFVRAALDRESVRQLARKLRR